MPGENKITDGEGGHPETAGIFDISISMDVGPTKGPKFSLDSPARRFIMVNDRIDYSKVFARLRRMTGRAHTEEHRQLYRETLRRDLLQIEALGAHSDPDIGCYYGGWNVAEITFFRQQLDCYYNCEQ